VKSRHPKTAPSSKGWECQFCDLSFPTDSARTLHYRNGPHEYCQPCGIPFYGLHHYTAHIRSAKHVPRSMKCPFCPQKFPIASSIFSHLESGTCSSGFNREMLNEAMHRLTPKIDLYQCPKASCGMKFRSLNSLVNHVESESCGVLTFGQVQQQVRMGIENMEWEDD